MTLPIPHSWPRGSPWSSADDRSRQLRQDRTEIASLHVENERSHADEGFTFWTISGREFENAG